MADVTDRWTQVQTLFEDALRRPADERTAWLRAVCGRDPALYREVEALLDGDAHQHTLLDGRAADLLPADDLDAVLTASRLGDRVGPWRIEAPVGEGGMGAVYRATRVDGGYEQTAALKLVKPGMDSGAVLARFRAERQILARLQHPGIARLLDGGLTEAERPYFAMEYVDGEPITAYCDARRLGVDDRLRLFVRVCEAVRYAHQALVVHRDLKPSNILVVEPEGEPPRPVLLDFGIARMLEDDDAALTRTGQRVLTPSYAAPEQVRGEAPTTATDVYALGGLLYRLLSGARPIETEGRTPREVEQAVLDETPLRPSEAVRSAAAAARDLPEAALAQRLRGDLDTICLTALDKDPARRYGSAAELLADVERHLRGLPIEARPATRAYRTRLFLRRHRAGVLGTAASVLALVTLTGFYTARLAAERDRAETEATTSAQTVEFLQGLFEGADPDASRGLDLTAAELLSSGAQRIATDLDGQPAVQAAMHLTIGRVYKDLGAYDSARVHLERGLALREGLGDRLDIAEAQSALAALLRRTGDLEESVRLHRATIDARAALLPADDPLLGDGHVSLGAALHDLSRFDDAEAAYREGVAVLAKTDAREAYAAALDNLAGLLYDRGDLDGALDIYRDVLPLKEEIHGPVHSAISNALNGYAIVLHEAGHLDDAEAAYRRSVEIDRTLLGDEHPDLAISLNNLGILLYDRADYDAAEGVFAEALAIKRATFPPDHPQIAATLKSLGFLYSDTGQASEAERHFREALAIRRAAFGDDHMGVAEVTGGLARLYTKTEEHARAEPLYRQTIRTLVDVLGADHPYAHLYRVRHADALHRTGRNREAETLFESAVPAVREALPDSTENRATVELLYGQYLAERGRCADAQVALADAEARYRALGNPEAAARAAGAACRA